MPPEDMPYIEMENVTKTYPSGEGEVIGVAKINMAVLKGELVAIVGHSGCGKSTLLHLISGLTLPTTGTVRIDGIEVTGPQPGCGFVFQEFSLFPWRTVVENVEFGLEIRGMSRRERRRIAEDYLQLVKLGHVRNSYPAVLSGGMKQRVAIARALAYDPPILLMDEPFGALDAQTRDEMHEDLLRIWSEMGKTIVFVTHNIQEAVFLASRVFLMKAPQNTLCKMYEVPLGYPRDLTTKISQTMNDLVFEITTALRTPDLGFVPARRLGSG